MHQNTDTTKETKTMKKLMIPMAAMLTLLTAIVFIPCYGQGFQAAAKTVGRCLFTKKAAGALQKVSGQIAKEAPALSRNSNWMSGLVGGGAIGSGAYAAFSADNRCSVCNGYGAVMCGSCSGWGFVYVLYMGWWCSAPCPSCDQTGAVACFCCGGSGHK